jgi:hypothetical protein
MIVAPVKNCVNKMPLLIIHCFWVCHCPYLTPHPHLPVEHRTFLAPRLAEFVLLFDFPQVARSGTLLSLGIDRQVVTLSHLRQSPEDEAFT